MILDIIQKNVNGMMAIAMNLMSSKCVRTYVLLSSQQLCNVYIYIYCIFDYLYIILASWQWILVYDMYCEQLKFGTLLFRRGGWRGGDCDR